jgi:hypothetical protein
VDKQESVLRSENVSGRARVGVVETDWKSE